MADPGICSIPDCGKPARARGWCNAHWKRWRQHGDPLAGGTAMGEAERYFREVVLAYDGNDCLTWPYTRSAAGYGRLGNSRVSRLVCEERHGPPPTPEHDAAHSCGKGHEGCVTKRHLSWKTRAENMADAIEHGTTNRGERHPNAKLTEAMVREILAMKGKKSLREIGKQFSVTQTHIGLIHRGKSWGWLA